MKTKKSDRVPVCRFCGKSGSGVQFSMFTPRFKPFGTACVACEATLPAGTPHPDEEDVVDLATIRER